MKSGLLATLLVSVIALSACASEPSAEGTDSEIRAAQPGIVDHNVIPKKSK